MGQVGKVRAGLGRMAWALAVCSALGATSACTKAEDRSNSAEAINGAPQEQDKEQVAASPKPGDAPPAQATAAPPARKSLVADQAPEPSPVPQSARPSRPQKQAWSPEEKPLAGGLRRARRPPPKTRGPVKIEGRAPPAKPRMNVDSFAERGGDAVGNRPPAHAKGTLERQMAASPAPPPPPVAPAEEAIDPNGRFATTYRPGGGHLAAFESAVARGIVPAGERELVSDIGARYAPAMDAPADAALALRMDLERAKAAPSGGAMHVRLALRSTEKAPAARPHLSVHLVLDISGSMRGEPIARAREAAAALVKKLEPSDDFSLVTFSSDADVRVKDGLVGPRRAKILSAIEEIKQGGGTNIGRGLELGYEQASQRSIPADAVKVVLLLSDGRANAGITNRERLSRMALNAFQDGVQTSALGLGADYDGALMSSIANDGAGGYYYLRDPDQIAPALTTELDKRLDPVATAVEVRVRLKPDVKLFHVYGSRRLSQAEAARVRAIEVAADQHAQKRDGIKQDRQDDTKGGMRFFIPAFARDDSHALLIKLGLPAGVGSRDIALVELKYKDRVAKKNVIEEIPLKATYADSDAESGATFDSSVSRTVQGFAAGETLAEAAQRIALNDRQRAIALLSEREGILRTAALVLREPLFQNDADRLARLRIHAGAAAGVGDPLVLAMLLETASRSHLR